MFFSRYKINQDETMETIFDKISLLKENYKF